MIRFLQPLWLLAIVPVLAVAAVYVWRQIRRRAFAVRFTNVELLRTLAPKGLGWRRHVSAVAMLLSLTALAFALARPAVDTEEPLERATLEAAHQRIEEAQLFIEAAHALYNRTTSAPSPVGGATPS